MHATKKVFKTGNSEAVRLPNKWLKRTGIKNGGKINLLLCDNICVLFKEAFTPELIDLIYEELKLVNHHNIVLHMRENAIDKSWWGSKNGKEKLKVKTLWEKFEGTSKDDKMSIIKILQSNKRDGE